MKNDTARAAAIVPAYNEQSRIGPVLEALALCPFLCEIIVVDDGSDPPLASVVEKFPVRLIRHERNKGKAAALQSGVAATTCDFVFFCDADLVNLRPDDVAALIMPVVSGEYRMSIGIRSNFAQRAIFWFAINSGERCLPKVDWLELPPFYKHGFRLEAGLNMRAWRQKRRILYLQLPYVQTARERKYGLVRGVQSRLWLCADVLVAWIYALRNNQ